jgi:hypothetical protein
MVANTAIAKSPANTVKRTFHARHQRRRPTTASGGLANNLVLGGLIGAYAPPSVVVYPVAAPFRQAMIPVKHDLIFAGASGQPMIRPPGAELRAGR